MTIAFFPAASDVTLSVEDSPRTAVWESRPGRETIRVCDHVELEHEQCSSGAGSVRQNVRILVVSVDVPSRARVDVEPGKVRVENVDARLPHPDVRYECNRERRHKDRNTFRPHVVLLEPKPKVNGTFGDSLAVNRLRRSQNLGLIIMRILEFARVHDLHPCEIHVVTLSVEDVAFGRALEVAIQVEDATSNEAHIIEADEDLPARAV